MVAVWGVWLANPGRKVLTFSRAGGCLRFDAGGQVGLPGPSDHARRRTGLLRLTRRSGSPKAGFGWCVHAVMAPLRLCFAELCYLT